ncbi:TPA: hypothetical protein ACVNQV_000001 [Escherichia coli]
MGAHSHSLSGAHTHTFNTEQ